MKYINLLLTFFLIQATYAQTCTDGSPAEIQSINVTNIRSFDGFGSGFNEVYALSFSTVGDVVGIDIAGINLSPIGFSWCIDSKIDFNNAITYTASDIYGSNCSDLPTSIFYDLADLGFVFPTTASGQVILEFYEDYDDVIFSADALYTAGIISVYVCPTGQILPVDLITFEALAKSNSIELVWETASETSHKGFEIQRSDDGKLWHKLAWVQGAEQTNQIKKYTFIDDNPIPGIEYYYRLKQVDIDEQYEYSKVITIKLASATNDYLSYLYPNPNSSGLIKLELYSSKQGTVAVSIIDTFGKHLKTTEHIVSSGFNILGVDTSSIPTGQYLLQVTTVEGLTLIQKLTII